MKKDFIIGLTSGIIIAGTIGALAAQYAATPNTFPIKLNGQQVAMSGYNIEGNTYFKLRDISDVVGGFDVDFQNNEILISKDDDTDTYNDTSYICYPESNVPDFSALYNVTSIDDSAIDAYCKYYNVSCVDHSYDYYSASMYDYMQTLESVGFEHLETYYYYGTWYLYGKDNNYVAVSSDPERGNCVSVYPINDTDYQPIIDSDLLIQRIDAYRESVINTWRNDMKVLNLSGDYSAYFTLAPIRSKGFYEIYGTYITYYYETLDGSGGSFNFEYLPETNQIMFVDDGSIYNISKY